MTCAGQLAKSLLSRFLGWEGSLSLNLSLHTRRIERITNDDRETLWPRMFLYEVCFSRTWQVNALGCPLPCRDKDIHFWSEQPQLGPRRGWYAFGHWISGRVLTFRTATFTFIPR